MKVYELMNELSKMPAGSVVKISLIKDEDELTIFDETDEKTSYGINFEVRQVEEIDKDAVCIDGW